MADQQAPPAGPDLTLGVALSDFTGETLLGHVGDDEVLLVRSGPDVFAIDAHCSHYHGPLAEGLVTGESIRCPWHHACFDLRTGEAVRAPALNPFGVWQVEREEARIFVRRKREQPKPRVKGAVRSARQNRDRRRRCGGFCRGRDAAAAGLSRQHRDAEQRCRGAGRPAEPVQGLSGRQRAGRLDAAAPGRFLCRGEDRPAAQDRSRLDRHQGAQRHARRRQSRCL